MSSRSFRRRNNRRKRNRAAAEPSPAPDGGPGPQERNPGRAGRRDPGGKRAGERGRDAPHRAEAPAPRPEPRVFPDCPVCRQPVRELASALTHRETGQPAHFDCIMRELRESNELGPQEKICYLGGGSFGILDFRQGRFVIRKRIPYEEKEAAQEWKKPLLISL